MFTIPKTKAEVITMLAGVAIAALGYYFPAILPAVAGFGKLLWASGIFTAGVGALQVKKAES